MAAEERTNRQTDKETDRKRPAEEHNNRFRSRGIESEVPIGRRWHDKHPCYPNVQVNLIVESVH